MEASNAQAPPSIFVTLAINPSILKEDEAVELSATAVSHASYPITILSHWTILDLHLAQNLKMGGVKFQCVDLNTDTPIQLQTRVCGRRL